MTQHDPWNIGFFISLKQGPVLDPNNRDISKRDSAMIRSASQIPIIRAAPVHL
jgi:hypothetical protein